MSLASVCRLKIKSSKRASDLLEVTPQIMELGLELMSFDKQSKSCYHIHCVILCIFTQIQNTILNERIAPNL